MSPIAEFGPSVAALEFPHAERLVHALLQRVLADPGNAPRVMGTKVCVLCTRGFDAYPPLLLFYAFDENAVYPLHVEVGDLELL